MACCKETVTSALADGKKTFYCRTLDGSIVDYRSADGKERLSRALAAGTAATFLSLTNVMTTQSDLAYCGLTTLSVCLNALEIDPLRQWRGPWRWFTEEQLECCVKLEIVKEAGITMDQFVCLGVCNGAVAEVLEYSGEDVRCAISKPLKEATDPAELAAPPSLNAFR